MCAVVLAFPIITLLRDGKIRQALLLTAVAAQLHRQHGVRRRVAHGTGHAAGHARRIRDGASEMAHQRRSCSLPPSSRRAGLDDSPQLQATTDSSRGITGSTRNSTSRHRSGCGSNSGRSRCGSLPRRRSSATAPDRREGCSRRRRPGPAVLAQAQVIGNPHNQTLNVAVQWGTIGVVILYAMWISHFAAVSRRGSGGLDRPDGGAAEHVQFAVQLASVRFP